MDENVVVGSVPAVAGKTLISDYGSLETLGAKLAAKRGGELMKASSRLTEGVLFYVFEFNNPLDPSLPRTGARDNRPTRQVELLELCVNKGRLWSVTATVSICICICICMVYTNTQQSRHSDICTYHTIPYLHLA